MNDFLGQTFITLFVIINPIAVVSVFMGLTHQKSELEKRHIALKAILIGTTLLFSFAFVGDKLLKFMGISEPAFKIAGGLLLLLAAVEMVISKPSTTTSCVENNESKPQQSSDRDNISVFPLAIPLISGPGALTSVVVLMRQGDFMHPYAPIAVLGILGFILILTYISLRLSSQIMSFLGITGTNILTRVFGILLSALAIQNIINGIKDGVTSLNSL